MATDNLCANSDSGDHRYFVFKTFEVFEPVNSDDVMEAKEQIPRQFYEKVEYAVLGCNCGSVIKKVVE